MNFTKMHGAGNDYIYINCLDKEIENPSLLAEKMSPRHFSVGADGIVLICPSKVADARMRMFNADGSEGKMCGNAIRCVGKYLYDNGIVKKTSLAIETLSGIKYLELNVVDGKVYTVQVDMGIATLEPEKIPVISSKPMINEKVLVGKKMYNITAVSMGNPHSVIFCDDVDELELEKIGPVFENLAIFPERVNTEFVKVIDKKTLKMRVWERGSGETYACGTGSCACVVAAILNGHCDYNTPITVKLIGGELSIICNKDLRVYMTGTATKVYDGVYEYED
ncbi:MAG TPA: diaminopimelate epimerase [Clostridia bacterium]|nr:diaminopimelate epimerase [Clostridia bacterium]